MAQFIRLNIDMFNVNGSIKIENHTRGYSGTISSVADLDKLLKNPDYNVSVDYAVLTLVYSKKPLVNGISYIKRYYSLLEVKKMLQEGRSLTTTLKSRLDAKVSTLEQRSKQGRIYPKEIVKELNSVATPLGFKEDGYIIW